MFRVSVLFCCLAFKDSVLGFTSRSNSRIFCYWPQKSGVCKTNGRVLGRMFKNVRRVIYKTVATVCFISLL